MNLNCTVRLHKVLEVREGQLTDSFDKFPYDEVKSQSFSLIFEEERKIGVHMHPYVISKIYRTNYRLVIAKVK